MMLHLIFTLDYEIHGNGEGCPYHLMVEPTRRMMDLFERYAAKLTIMADVAEILKFKEYNERVGRDDYYYEAVAAQLRDAVRRGHDVQLHLHPSYFNARNEGGRWVQDWSQYNFARLPLERLVQIIRVGKQYLETLLQPVVPDYQCIAFRAANWAVSPSINVVRALLQNGIRIDTSVFKHGRREGLVSFDYSEAHSELVPWTVNEHDICLHDDRGKLTEVPIYCEKRWIGAFLTGNRLYRAYLSRKHGISRTAVQSGPAGPMANAVFVRIARFLGAAFRRHAWKADFNQCSGRQLVHTLERVETRYGTKTAQLPLVLIGHSKLFTRFNERRLAPLLAFVDGHTDRFSFAIFGDFDFIRA